SGSPVSMSSARGPPGMFWTISSGRPLASRYRLSCQETRRAPRFEKATATSSLWASTRRSRASATGATDDGVGDAAAAVAVRADAPGTGALAVLAGLLATGAPLAAGVGRRGVGAVGKRNW